MLSSAKAQSLKSVDLWRCLAITWLPGDPSSNTHRRYTEGSRKTPSSRLAVGGTFLQFFEQLGICRNCSFECICSNSIHLRRIRNSIGTGRAPDEPPGQLCRTTPGLLLSSVFSGRPMTRSGNTSRAQVPAPTRPSDQSPALSWMWRKTSLGMPKGVAMRSMPAIKSFWPNTKTRSNRGGRVGCDDGRAQLGCLDRIVKLKRGRFATPGLRWLASMVHRGEGS